MKPEFIPQTMMMREFQINNEVGRTTNFLDLMNSEALSNTRRSPQFHHGYGKILYFRLGVFIHHQMKGVWKHHVPA